MGGDGGGEVVRGSEKASVGDATTVTVNEARDGGDGEVKQRRDRKRSLADVLQSTMLRSSGEERREAEEGGRVEEGAEKVVENTDDNEEEVFF